jgi:hypothetical protein
VDPEVSFVGGPIVGSSMCSGLDRNGTRQSASSGSSKAYFSTNIRTLIGWGTPFGAERRVGHNCVRDTSAYGTHLRTGHICIQSTSIFKNIFSTNTRSLGGQGHGVRRLRRLTGAYIHLYLKCGKRIYILEDILSKRI